MPVKNFQGKNLRSAIFSVAAQAAPGFPEKLARVQLPGPYSRRLKTPKGRAPNRIPKQRKSGFQGLRRDNSFTAPC